MLHMYIYSGYYWGTCTQGKKSGIRVHIGFTGYYYAQNAFIMNSDSPYVKILGDVIFSDLRAPR